MDKKVKIIILRRRIINLEIKINIMGPLFFDKVKDDIEKIYEDLEELNNGK